MLFLMNSKWLTVVHHAVIMHLTYFRFYTCVFWRCQLCPHVTLWPWHSLVMYAKKWFLLIVNGNDIWLLSSDVAISDDLNWMSQSFCLLLFANLSECIYLTLLCITWVSFFAGRNNSFTVLSSVVTWHCSNLRRFSINMEHCVLLLWHQSLVSVVSMVD